MESPARGRRAADRQRLYSAHRHSLDEGIRDLDHGALSPTQRREAMTTIYSARWVLPVVSAPIEHGAVAVAGPVVAGVGTSSEIVARFPEARVESFGESVILPGLVNTHTHLELTAMRGYLENEKRDFFAWLRKLTDRKSTRLNSSHVALSRM